MKAFWKEFCLAGASSNNIGPMDLINIRRVAWDTGGEPADTPVDRELVELLAAKILERLK